MVDGMLRYYMHHQNPEELSDHEWARQFEILQKIRKMERDSSMVDINKMFGGK